MKTWAKVNLPVEVYERIEKLIESRKDLGYKSVSDFALDAVRLRINQIEREEREEKMISRRPSSTK